MKTRRALRLMAICVTLVMFLLPELTTAAATNQLATPSPATPAASGTPIPLGAPDDDPLSTAMTPPTEVSAAEQALADKYVPVAQLKQQPEPCSTVGEPYLPVAVEISLNDPEVKLRRAKRKGEKEDPVVKDGPSAQDLVATDSSYYLDLPGSSLEPGCDYEKWSAKRVEELGLEPSAYARIATQPSEPGKLALQYWFYWAFDDFNNTHESDWEMLQLTFDADTPEEALTKEPTLVTMAQHAGGENSDWDSEKLILEDETHIVTFPAAGSHADYYDSAVWLGWGAQGTGFGCDRIDAPVVRTPLKAIVIPREIDPDGPFAWALFKGRWGEKHPWEYNGPLSPNLGKKWSEPVSWTDGLRENSLPIPQQRTLGTDPSAFFCSVAELGGNVMKVVPDYPQWVAGITIAILIGLLLLSFLSWQYFKRAFWLYFRYIHVFLFSSILLVPIAAAATTVQYFVSTNVPSEIFGVSISVGGGTSLGTGLGFFLQLVLITLIAPGVIYATAHLVRKERANFFSAVWRTYRDIPQVAGAYVYNTLIVILLSLTIVGIPFAIYRGVQWAYSAHAVILDGATPRGARHVSRNVIKGDWLRTLGMGLLVTYVATIPGPVIGLVLILTNVANLRTAGTVSSVVFAVVYPITIIASTLYYQHRKEQKAERAAEGKLGDSFGQAVWLRLRHPLTGGWGKAGRPEPVATPAPEPGEGAPQAG